jgi:hypothetical protein
MQVIDRLESRRSLLILLAVIFIGISGLLCLIPPGEFRFLGAGLAVIGAINLLLHKRIGDRSLEWAQSMPPFIVGFWTRIGKEGARLLYLWIGIMLVAAGLCALLISAL